MRKSVKRDLPFFVLGTGRTGSTFLHQFIRYAYPAVACHQEPCQGWLFNLYSHLRSAGSLNDWLLKLIEKQLLWTRHHLCRHDSRKPYIEVTPYLYGLGDIIQNAFGSLRILHMIRHPLTYIPSALNFEPRAWRAYLCNIPMWHLNVSRALPEEKLSWNRLNPIEKQAWFWRFANQKIRSNIRPSDRYLLVRYEDLFSSSAATRRATLESIVNFFELTLNNRAAEFPFDQKINPSHRRHVPLWKDWSAETLESVYRICRPMMRESGYDVKVELKTPRAEIVENGLSQRA